MLPGAASGHTARCHGTAPGGWLNQLDWRTEIGDAAVLEEIKQEIAQ
jgi:hypothetical protein